MFDTIAPVLLFTYKRLDVLKQTVTALQNNLLARETELFIFSDGGKSDADKEKVDEVRKYIKSVGGFKKVVVIESAINKGLANSIIGGVTSIIANYESVIVLEDDLVTSTNFLAFMNQALEHYRKNPKIFSVAGFSFMIDGLAKKDVYFTMRASSWGWATWKDRWEAIDWEVRNYNSFKKSSKQRQLFNRMGSDMAGMLDKQMNGKMDSWAIRWCFHQFQNQTFTVNPARSKIRNIGFAEGATHTVESFKRYDTELDASANTDFNFTDDIKMEPQILKQFVKHYSIRSRIKYKILNTGSRISKIFSK